MVVRNLMITVVAVGGLGAGANVGVANGLRRDYGVKSLTLFVSLLIGSTLVIGLTADRTIIHGAAKATDPTHALVPFSRLASVEDRHANNGFLLSELPAVRRLRPFHAGLQRNGAAAGRRTTLR